MSTASAYTLLVRCDGTPTADGRTRCIWHVLGIPVPRKIAGLFLRTGDFRFRLFDGDPPHLDPTKEVR